MELLSERPIYLVAKEYGRSPAEIRRWSHYDFQRAWLFLVAENGGGNVTEEEIQDNIAARLTGRENEVAILEHVPSYWTTRTREQVTAEGYNAEYVAEELAALGLAFVGEAVTNAGDSVTTAAAHSVAVDDDALTTGPLETPED